MNWSQAKENITMNNGYVIAMFSDRVIVSSYPLKQEDEEVFNNLFEKYILDCRVFDNDKEYRFFRGDIGRKINYRLLDDSNNDYIDREYYLDIDTSRSDGIYATGGGKYSLPIDDINDAKIYVREYITYDEVGHARVYDWRVKGFGKE